MSLGTFKRGIFPPLNKDLTSEKEFTNLSIPHICYIPLQQHIGNPASPVVKAGDLVQEGQLIGKADGTISANVHSSIPGKVVEIKDHPTAFSLNGKCVVIEADGKFSSSGKSHERVSWQNISNEILLERIFQAGIVGLSGEAFPTSIKLSPHKDKKIKCLIINCAESEPYLTSDDMLIRTHSEEILEGIDIILKILGIDTAYIGIGEDKFKAIQTLKNNIEKFSANKKEKIQLSTLKTKYPQGAEKQLIYAILKMEIPCGKKSMDTGIIVLNTATVFAIREACVFGKPLFERFITISGKIVTNPGNYKVRIGTRIIDVIKECGGLKEEPAKIIIGGPMRGTALHSSDVPVTKGTTGILFLSQKEVNATKYGPCIRCGRCVAACPARLVPCDLGKAALNEQYDLLKKLNASECIICGACSFVCPAKRPLSFFINNAQKKSLDCKIA